MSDALAKLIMLALEENYFVNPAEKTCVSDCKYLFKFSVWGRLNRLVCILQMKLRKQVFSCGFYENFKIIIFYRTHPGSYTWKSNVFLEITYNDSLQQCLRSSRGKTREKNFWGPKLGQTSKNRVRNYILRHFVKFFLKTCVCR